MSDSQTRSQDIYDEYPGAPKPPLLPVPPWDDLNGLERLGIGPTTFAKAVLKATLVLSGYRAFHHHLETNLEHLLRRSDIRGGYLFAPVVSATLALEDDPRNLSPLERAATLVAGAGTFLRDLLSGNIPPDIAGGHVLEMGQYFNFFGTSLNVENNRPRLFKSGNDSRITVLLRDQLYPLDLGSSITNIQVERIHDTLSALVGHSLRAARAHEALSPGILTSAGHLTQCTVFTKMASNATNRRSLELLRHSAFTLCLELDNHPTSYAEAAYQTHRMSSHNRWHHSSLQIIVFGNGKACIIANFYAYLDGNTMMRGGAELQRRAARCAIQSRGGETPAKLPVALPLQWELSPRWCRQAQKELSAVQDDQQPTFFLEGFGTSFFRALELAPIPTFVIALEGVAISLCGRPASIVQFISKSKYRCMGLSEADVATAEVIRAARAMENVAGTLSDRLQVLQSAIVSQEVVCRKARNTMDIIERFGLFLANCTPLRMRIGGLVALVALMIVCVVGRYKFRRWREVVISHPEIYKEIPVVGRPGIRLPYITHFGLHYQICEDKTVLTFMPSTKWSIPNSEIVSCLRTKLLQLERYAQRGGRESS